MRSKLVSSDPEIMHGTPCFTGTRVPIQNLIDCIEGGETIDEFLDGFPSVSREQAFSFLEQAAQRMLADVAS